jgi:hypothetical protein
MASARRFALNPKRAQISSRVKKARSSMGAIRLRPRRLTRDLASALPASF